MPVKTESMFLQVTELRAAVSSRGDVEYVAVTLAPPPSDRPLGVLPPAYARAGFVFGPSPQGVPPTQPPVVLLVPPDYARNLEIGAWLVLGVRPMTNEDMDEVAKRLASIPDPAAPPDPNAEAVDMVRAVMREIKGPRSE